MSETRKRKFAGLVRIDMVGRSGHVHGTDEASSVIKAVVHVRDREWSKADGCWIVRAGLDVLGEHLKLAGFSIRVIWPTGSQVKVKLNSRTIAGPAWHLKHLDPA